MEDKILSKVELGFENVEGIIIDGSMVSRAILGNISESILLQEKQVFRFKNIDDLTLIMKADLFSEANLSFEDMHEFKLEPAEKLIEMFRNHLSVWKDITSIDLVYEDGTKESFGVPWSDENENCNNLQRFYEEAGEFILKIQLEKE